MGLQCTVKIAHYLSSICALSCHRRCCLAPASALCCVIDINSYCSASFPTPLTRSMGLRLQEACEHCVTVLECNFVCSTVATQMAVLSGGSCVQKNSTSSSYATGVASVCKVAAGPLYGSSVNPNEHE